MNEKKFKYDVAFSFLYQDEKLVYELNETIGGQISTFIYSKEQESLVGTDGVNSFNTVFNKESRVVVILYRDGWGKTPWTKVEEIAIKNRAFEGDWDFFLVIKMDTSPLPSWIPKINIWLDLEAFGLKETVGAILYKVKQSGGEIHRETVEEKTQRMLSKKKNKVERLIYLRTNDAIVDARNEIASLISKFKALQPIIEGDNSLHLGTDFRPDPPMFQLCYKGYCLCINNRSPFEQNYAQDDFGRPGGYISTVLYTKSGHVPFNYSEDVQESATYKYDRDSSGRNGWSDEETGQEFLTSDELLDEWISKFINGIGEVGDTY